jgi:hypothetical protein
VLSGAGCCLLQGTDALVKVSEKSSTSASDCHALHIGVRDETHLFVEQAKPAEKTDSFFSDLETLAEPASDPQQVGERAAANDL